MKAASKDFRHRTPDDLAAVLAADPALRERWDSLTELARSDWICWMTTVKQQATRDKHLARLQGDLLAGKRRPCCWPGCPHRNANARKWVKA